MSKFIIVVSLAVCLIALSEAVAYTNSCVCGHAYDNNCAHYLSNWMIRNGVLSENPSGTYTCTKGRPIRAKEMRAVFRNKLGLSKHNNPPRNGANSYIYCERNSDHQGHVYYGTKTNCVAGTGTWSSGCEYYEYYY